MRIVESTAEYLVLLEERNENFTDLFWVIALQITIAYFLGGRALEVVLVGIIFGLPMLTILSRSTFPRKLSFTFDKNKRVVRIETKFLWRRIIHYPIEEITGAKKGVAAVAAGASSITYHPTLVLNRRRIINKKIRLEKMEFISIDEGSVQIAVEHINRFLCDNALSSLS